MCDLNEKKEVDIREKYNFMDAEVWHKHDTEHCAKCTSKFGFVITKKLLGVMEYPQELCEFFHVTPFNADVHRCPHCGDYTTIVYGWEGEEW